MNETPMRVAAHHHFWDATRATYPWMVGEALDPVRRPFTPDGLAPELAAQRVAGTVLVQTISSEDETRGFLELAARTDFVWGVIGWVDLTSGQVGDRLDAVIGGAGGDRLVGIRHQVHDEADPDWLSQADVRKGLAAVQERGLVYDLLVRARELPSAIETVRALPDLQFVLDHIAKPRIADGEGSRVAAAHARARGAPERCRKAVRNGDGGELGFLDRGRPAAVRRVGRRLVRCRAADVRLRLARLPAGHVIRRGGRGPHRSPWADLSRRCTAHLRSERRRRVPPGKSLIGRAENRTSTPA